MLGCIHCSPWSYAALGPMGWIHLAGGVSKFSLSSTLDASCTPSRPGWSCIRTQRRGLTSVPGCEWTSVWWMCQPSQRCHRLDWELKHNCVQFGDEARSQRSAGPGVGGERSYSKPLQPPVLLLPHTVPCLTSTAEKEDRNASKECLALPQQR